MSNGDDDDDDDDDDNDDDRHEDWLNGNENLIAVKQLAILTIANHFGDEDKDRYSPMSIMMQWQNQVGDKKGDSTDDHHWPN